MSLISQHTEVLGQYLHLCRNSFRHLLAEASLQAQPEGVDAGQDGGPGGGADGQGVGRVQDDSLPGQAAQVRGGGCRRVPGDVTHTCDTLSHWAPLDLIPRSSATSRRT